MAAPLTGHTFTGHTTACAAGVAVQTIIERDKLVEKVAAEGPVLMQNLRDALADRPYVGNIRGRGFFIGVELVADPETKEPYRLRLAALRPHPRPRVPQRPDLLSLGGNVDGVKGDQVILAPPYNRDARGTGRDRRQAGDDPIPGDGGAVDATAGRTALRRRGCP